jgi:hypothetical protein
MWGIVDSEASRFCGPGFGAEESGASRCILAAIVRLEKPAPRLTEPAHRRRPA